MSTEPILRNEPRLCEVGEAVLESHARDVDEFSSRTAVVRYVPVRRENLPKSGRGYIADPAVQAWIFTKRTLVANDGTTRFTAYIRTA
jgi:hypothetical protein